MGVTNCSGIWDVVQRDTYFVGCFVKREFTDAEIACAEAYVAVRSEVKITRLDAHGKGHPAKPLSVDAAANLLAVGVSRTHGPHRRQP